MAFTISYVYQAIDRFTPAAKKIGTAFSRVTGKARKLTQNLKKTSRQLRSLGADLSLKVSAPLAAFAVLALRASANIETLQTSFESLLGSTEKAKNVVADLVDFTAKTPFQLEGVGKAAKQLLAFGVAQDQLLPTLKQLGDIAAGANVPLTDIASIFGKAKSKGKLMTEELLQLSERGIPIIDLLAKRFGVTKDVIFEAASKSQISFKFMEDAFGTLTAEGGIFFDQMKKQSGTLAGIFSTLKDNVNLSLAAIGDTLVETLDLKELITGLIIGLQSITVSIQAFAAENPKLTKFLVIMTGILAILGPLAVGIGLVGLALGTAFGPVTLIVVGIAALISAGVLLMDSWKKIGAVIGGIIDKIVERFDRLVSAVSIGDIGGAFSAIGSLLGFGTGEGPEQIKANPDLITQRERSAIDINMNIRDQSGAVTGVESKVKGSANFNVGRNMAVA
jgi:tape measure domain-containing protein